MILLRQVTVTLTSPRSSTLVRISSAQIPNSRSRSPTTANHTSLRSNSTSMRPQNTPLTEIFTMLSSILCTSSRAPASPLTEPPWTPTRSSMVPSLESSSIWKRVALQRTPSSKLSLMLSIQVQARSECASSSARSTCRTTGAMMVPSLRPPARKVSNGVSLNKFNPSPRHSLTS